ncbi:MAG: PQQ-dependent sugar dehydrogenase [Mariprofundus sp.]
MRVKISRTGIFIQLMFGLLALFSAPLISAAPLDRIKLPAGFSISYFAEHVQGARSLALGEQGTVFVGNRNGDSIIALVDEDSDGVAENRYVIGEYLDTPNGIAFYKGALYVAENQRIIRFPDIEQRLDDPPEPEVVFDALPDERHHGWRYLAIGPEGYLSVAIGAPCNICNKPLPFATVCRLKPDGGEFEVFAKGVRNSVGFTWHPETEAMWFTDNGRDWMGDDSPPDELNRAGRKGLHFGYPFRHGANIPDPKFGRVAPNMAFEPPALEMGAHVAALGLRFYTGSMFPAAYKNRLFIAQHGSWNRTTPVGYRIIAVTIEDGRASDKQVFAEGWLLGSIKWGRPVDVLVMPDGALLISDDMHGAVYRISYQHQGD